MENNIKAKNPMGYEDILKLIIKMSLPAMLSMLIQAMYNITDSYFVAKLSEKAFRATSLSYPIQIIIVAFGVGTGVGINSFISRSLGADQEERANQGAMHGLILIILSWLIFLLFRFTLLESFFDYFTQEPDVKQMGMEYLGIVSMLSIFSLTQVTIEKTIQGTGNMLAPMIIQLVGAITNIILDPIMIFGLFGFPALGIRGAAIATIIGQAVGASLGLYMLLGKKTIIEIDFSKFKFSLDIIKDIYKVGFPSILMQSVTALVTTVMNLIIITHSELAVSVLGIYLKLESFVFMPVFGLSQGVLPIIGYNYGARNKDRITKAHKYGVIIAISIMCIGIFIFQVFPAQLISIFDGTNQMVDMGVYTLRIISLGYIFAGIGIINSTYFQALGLGKFSLLITALRQIIVILPLAYFMSQFGLNYVWIAYPVAELVGVTTSIIIQRKVKKNYIDII